ncbi:hypothetical protein [Chromobacterium sp.]|uniref:hypothetical protein n=1 Tax=Chromobacterium sp. TaxID=306190 RepID=UPI0035AF7F80
MKLKVLALGLALCAAGAGAAEFEWLDTGLTDCTGRDVGSTSGSVPDNHYAASGMTAVCWDGKVYSNRNSPGVAFCTYKNVSRTACVGGINTGKAYSAAPVKEFAWEEKGIGDCAGRDVNASYGSSLPSKALATARTIAVCWDGKTYNNVNNPGQAFCTYKSATVESCTGGRNPGWVYAPAKVAAMKWQAGGIGDCTGQDYAQTDGKTPHPNYLIEGTTAVCWDGVEHSNRNAPGKAFCTYKTVKLEQCAGGRNPGWMYSPARAIN